MNFKEWLEQNYRYSKRTLEEKQRQVEHWQSLCGNHQTLENLSRSELLKITEILKNKYSSQTLNSQLKTIEQYFYFLTETGKRKDHPLKNFRIKTEKKPLLKGFLTEEELNQLYEKFPDKGHFKGQFDVYAKRNKVILGLIVYQGLNTGSLEKLKLKDIDLKKGFIKIPATDHKLNPRKLPLEAVQVIALDKYLKDVRPELLKLTTAKKDSLRLFPKSEKTEFSSVTGSILKRLKKQSEVTSLYQIRISRIALWLKQYNLRETQYKAGYKSLQSLEAFDRDALEELKEAVEKYHPFK
jgi:site-specific recombinase XerD